MDTGTKRILFIVLFMIIICLSTLTKMGCEISSYLVIKLIQIIHILIILFIVFGPFVIKDKELLIIYILFVSFIIFHWIVLSDVCVLTLVEQWFTGKPSGETFIGRLVKPVYNVTDRHVTILTWIVLCIAIVRVMSMK